MHVDADAAEYLVTAKNQTGGVELLIFAGDSTAADWSSYKQKDIPDHFLSPECGEDFRWCSQLEADEVMAAPAAGVKETSTRSFVVILQLLEGLGLQKFRTDGAGSLSFSGEPHIIDVAKYRCSPSTTHRIAKRYYVVCSNSGTGYIRLLELKLNATHLQKSTVSDLEYLDIDSAHNRTNTFYADLPSRSGSVIYFASGYNLYYFKPLDYLTGELSVDLQGSHCSATAIDYVGGWEMIVYCEDDRAVYVDINREHVAVPVPYSQYGKPYICPNPDVYLGVHTDTQTQYITYGSRSRGEGTDIKLPGRNFDNGLCLGSESNTLFAFTDRENGTKLLNATGNNVRLLSDTACTDNSCQPLVELKDRYLTIREKKKGVWRVLVLDSQNNFSRVLEVVRCDADMLALFDDIRVSNNEEKGGTAASPLTSSGTAVSPLTTDSPAKSVATPRTLSNSAIEKQASDGTNGAVVPAVSATFVGLVIFAVVSIAAVTVGVLYYKKRKKDQ